jgi:hypothetical protein
MAITTLNWGQIGYLGTHHLYELSASILQLLAFGFWTRLKKTLLEVMSNSGSQGLGFLVRIELERIAWIIAAILSISCLQAAYDGAVNLRGNDVCTVTATTL